MKFSLMWSSLPFLLQGALLTLQITVISVAVGIFIGTFVGMARISRSAFVRSAASVYVDFIRGTPLLVQIFIVHFGMPGIIGRPIPPLLSALTAMSINSGAYVAEIVRSGIQSIDKGQMEAARSLGLSWAQAMQYVILPQAFRRIIPPLGNEFIAMLKDSSLVSVIALEELVRKGQIIISRSFKPFEIWIDVAIIFLLMTLPISRFVSWIERRLRVGNVHH